jgi:hypothetical protein
MECNASWIYIFRLDGQYSGPEEYFWILFQFRFNYDLLVQQETGLHSPEHYRRQNTLLQVLLVEKQRGSESYSHICSVLSWNPQFIHCDDQSCVKLSVISCVFMTKHIEMRYHYVRDIVQKNILSIQYVPDDKTIHKYFDQASVIDKVCVLSRQAWYC